MSQAISLDQIADVSQAVLAVFAIASFIGLVRYVHWTKNMALSSKQAVEASSEMIDEMRRARVSEAIPYVIVELEMRPASFVFVHLVNCGRTLARNVEVDFDPPMLVPIVGAGGEVVPFSVQPVRSLAPGQRIATALGPGYQIMNQPYPQRYTAKVSWDTDLLPDRQSMIIDLDLSVFARVRPGGGGPLHEIAKASEKMAAAMDRISRNEKPFRVIVDQLPPVEVKTRRAPRREQK